VRLVRFVALRLLYVAFQLLGVVTITFFLVHLLPGNPAESLAGVGASPRTIKAIEQQLGTDKPLPEQYVIYLNHVIHGQFGDSIFTGQTVLQDLGQRIPATLELVVLSMVLAVIIGIPLGIFAGLRPTSLLSRIVFVYGMLTGALPDFWLALILIFVFFFLFHLAPPPLGRLGLVAPPPHRTGFFLVDSLLMGDLQLLASAVSYLALPSLTLVLVYMGNIVKMARTSVQEVANSDFVEYARACGLPERVVLRYMLRNALAPVVTVVAFTFGFLLGGAVLVETIFSWGGLGQYAVQSITNSDYAPITGFVLVAALGMALIYLLLDLVYAALDPRIQY
jgi:ABC-type dipeptide/oligopeptide/nickel transport system permease component